MKWNLIGNQWAEEILQSHLSHDNLRHAYLFTGPEGVGREALAIAFAKAINCENPPEKGGFCDVCRNCVQIGKQQHVDLHLVEREGGSKQILVGQVRELQKKLAMTPFQAKYHIVLFRNFEDAHVSAANALLKTLEEPNERVVLLFVVDHVNNLLPTIVSRCQELQLRPVPADELVSALITRFGVAPQEAALLAYVSGGCPQLALQLHADEGLMTKRVQFLQDLLALVKMDRVGRFSYVEELGLHSSKEEKQDAVADLRECLKVWFNFWRDVLVMKHTPNVKPINLDVQNEIVDVATAVSVEVALAQIEGLEKTMAMMETNTNLRLMTEVLVLDLPYL
jgi:DNA polymerase-3 subunit delta'